MIEVPPITAAATAGRTDDSASDTLAVLVKPDRSRPAIPARTAEMTYSTIRTCHARAPDSRAAIGLSPMAYRRRP